MNDTEPQCDITANFSNAVERATKHFNDTVAYVTKCGRLGTTNQPMQNQKRMAESGLRTPARSFVIVAYANCLPVEIDEANARRTHPNMIVIRFNVRAVPF